jgi:hypothetical protein
MFMNYKQLIKDLSRAYELNRVKIDSCNALLEGVARTQGLDSDWLKNLFMRYLSYRGNCGF